MGHGFHKMMQQKYDIVSWKNTLEWIVFCFLLGNYSPKRDKNPLTRCVNYCNQSFPMAPRVMETKSTVQKSIKMTAPHGKACIFGAKSFLVMQPRNWGNK